MVELVMDRKLDSLQRCLERVRERCPASVEALQQDIDAQDVLVLNLSRAVQLCVDIALHLLSQRRLALPDTMGQAFECLAAEGLLPADLAQRLRKSVGFRNLAVHDYEQVRWEIVYAIATEHLADFRAFAQYCEAARP